MSLDLIRNKPVFDTEIIKLGQAVKIKDNKAYYKEDREWRHALILAVSYNTIKLAAYDKEGDIEKIEYSISEILDNTCEIKVLEDN